MIEESYKMVCFQVEEVCKILLFIFLKMIF